jgi:hypothetical protein
MAVLPSIFEGVECLVVPVLPKAMMFYRKTTVQQEILV